MERLRSGDPELIGPWQIVNRLGSGGMGIVYMGTNGTRAAAIKVVREFLLEDPASRTRLAREVETLLRVKSDYVAEIVGSDIDGNPAWIATNYVDGPSLKLLVEKEGPLSQEKWTEFARGFLSALSSVHAVGVVHRDIKPSNILLTKTGPKLIDFGISFVNDATSLTGTGMVAGTPAWLAPEQFLGREITTAVDNFAAGSTLMYAATGKTPWGADDSSVGAVMHTILVEEPELSALTEFQIEIITPLLTKDAQSRKTASQMLKRLNEGKFDPETAQVMVDGETITRTLTKSYLALHKPKGVLSTMFDPEGRPSLDDFIDLRKERLFHVGRLDKDSEGLILLTNDGDLTFRATHPSFGLEKTYIIEFDGILPTGVDKVLLKGVELEDGMGRVLTFKQLSPKWIEVSIHEGRYHIIRRLMEAVGVNVLRLIRTKFGPISLGDTPEGRWRDLNDGELMNLRKALDL
jgi:23S rRNA pseudouridine2605 synthase